MATERPTTRIELRAGGAPKVRKKLRFRNDARMFVAGMFKMWQGGRARGGGTIRPFGLGLNFNPNQVFNRTAPTSMRRLWSQLTGMPMLREKPSHPRPWEGPIETRWERISRGRSWK